MGCIFDQHGRMTMESAEATVLCFGKHKGETLGQVAATDVLYLDWLAGQGWLKDNLLEAVLVLCKKHERRIDQLVNEGGRGRS
jgi:hypothetical protein